MYLKGNDINAEQTPPILNANASVSVPVDLDATSFCIVILFFLAVSSINFNKLF